MDKSDPSPSGEAKGPSMKERLLAQRKAEADAAAKAASDPKMAAAASRPAAAAPAPQARPAPAPAAKAPSAPPPRERVAAAAAAAGRPSAAERMAARRGTAHPHTELSPDVKREVELLKQRESKTMTYVWIACGVLFLAAGGVLGNTLIKQANMRAEEKAYQDKLDNFLRDVKALDPLKESDAHKILDMCSTSEAKQTYKQSRIEGEVARAMSIAQRTIDSATERKDMVDRLDQLVRIAEGADSQPLDTLKSARRTATDLKDKLGGTPMDDDYKKRLADAGERLDRAYLAKLMSDAKAKGQTREALTAYTMAEIEVRNALDNTLRGTKDTDRKKWYQDLFKTLVTDSDATATTVFTQAVIDNEPWKDALAAETEWLHSSDLVGFALKDGVLHAVGAKAGSGRIGTLSTGDRQQLKDFVAQIEFTVVKGNLKLHVRVYNRMDSSEYLAINTIGKDSQFKPGQAYTMELRVIGSVLSAKFPNSDLEPQEIQIKPTMQRFGSIGLALDEDCEIKLSTFKYKELRSNRRP